MNKYTHLVLACGNITNLGGGPLRNDHNPEGSGNLIWLFDD